jgi:hypothetical protein
VAGTAGVRDDDEIRSGRLLMKTTAVFVPILDRCLKCGRFSTICDTFGGDEKFCGADEEFISICPHRAGTPHICNSPLIFFCFSAGVAG